MTRRKTQQDAYGDHDSQVKNHCCSPTTYQRVLEDVGVLVEGGRVDGDAVALTDQVRVAVVHREASVLRHVADDKHTARQATRLAHHAVCAREAENIARQQPLGGINHNMVESPFTKCITYCQLSLFVAFTHRTEIDWPFAVLT